MKGRGVYIASAHSIVAIYKHDRVSLPECVRPSPALIDILPGAAKLMLVEYGEGMLRDPQLVARIKSEQGPCPHQPAS